MSVQDAILKSLEAMECCTIRDISYFLKFVEGMDIEPAQIRYGLETLKAKRKVGKLKIRRRNIHYLSTKGKSDVIATLKTAKDDIVENLDTKLLFHTRELASHASRISNIGRDVAFCILRHLSAQGKVAEIFAVSYRGKIFRLYFHPDKKKTVEEHIDKVKEFILSKRLVFTRQDTVRECTHAWEVTPSDVSDFKNILRHLSYMGEVNQIYFVEGHPFAVPGHATELKKLLEARE